MKFHLLQFAVARKSNTTPMSMTDRIGGTTDPRNRSQRKNDGTTEVCWFVLSLMGILSHALLKDMKP